jgi:hypothetical protein
MKIYTIDNDGYIVGNGNFGDKYVMNPNDIEGESPYPNNHHHETGLERPLTQEQLKQQEINDLNNWLDLRRNIDHPEKADKQAQLLKLLG